MIFLVLLSGLITWRLLVCTCMLKKSQLIRFIVINSAMIYWSHFLEFETVTNEIQKITREKKNTAVKFKRRWNHLQLLTSCFYRDQKKTNPTIKISSSLWYKFRGMEITLRGEPGWSFSCNLSRFGWSCQVKQGLCLFLSLVDPEHCNHVEIQFHQQ